MSGRGVDLDELAALEEQRAFLLKSLEDLDREHDAGDLDDADYETLRADYTARAARVIDAIDNREELIDASDPGGHRGRRVVALIAVAVVALVAGLVVTRTSGSRHETAKTDASITPSAETKVCIDKMGTTFGSDGNSTDGTRFASDAVATLECFTKRIEADPDDVVAWTYRGRTESLLTTALQGVAAESDVANFATRALADLTRALKLAPDYPDALAFAAINAISEGDIDSARRYVARIARLQLQANDPILAIVNNAIRPALTETTSTTAATSTSVPPTTAPATG